MPRPPNSPTSRSVHSRNLASKKGAVFQKFRRERALKPKQSKSRSSKRQRQHPIVFYEADQVIIGQPPRQTDLRFTIPDVPRNRDLLMFLNTRAHDMMSEVVQELKIKYAVVSDRVAEVE